jgi:anti-sigma factor RsiW
MSQACARWRGDIGAYIVGALSPAEAARVKRHLRGCAACRAEYHDLIPVRDWLGRLDPADGMPARQPPGGPRLDSSRPPHHPLRRRLMLTSAVIAAAVVAVITAISARPGPAGFQAFDPATGVRGQASLHATPAGTQIELTVTGLPAGQRCTLVTVSPAGTAVAGTWAAGYGGTARITGASAIPVSQLTALRIEAPAHRLLLSIPV